VATGFVATRIGEGKTVMKVAITDYSFADLSIEEQILRPLGHEIVAWKEKRSADQLPELVANADAIITQFAPVDASVIARMQQAKVIVRYGIGVDNVDLAAARERGIPVCNVPDYCVDEVADHTLAFILAATRQVVSNCLQLRQGTWGMATPLEAMRTLRDLTVGVVGFGRIGREVVARLRPFKCRVLVHDPVMTADVIEHAGAKAVPLNTLLTTSDVITLHCPSTAETRGLISGNTLAATKRNVILVNLSRGDLVDTAALVAAIKDGHVSAAALDVFAPEPLPSDHPLLKFNNVVVASHIASTSVSAVRKLRETAAQLAAQALSGRPLQNIVNGVPPRQPADLAPRLI
jgi:D-3-phosphoglycerate dehydrogenase